MKPLLALAVLFVAVGCGSPPSSSSSETDPPAPAPNVAERIPDEDLTFETRIGLQSANGKLSVGARETVIDDFFPRPQNTTLLSEAPESTPPNVRARGWIGDTESFGALIINDSKGDARLVGAMLQRQKVTEDALRELVRSYQSDLGEPNEKIDGRRVRYWFWEEAPHRLAICAVQTRDGVNVTLAMGEARTMTRLRMDPALARSDSMTAEGEFLKRDESSPQPVRKG